MAYVVVGHDIRFTRQHPRCPTCRRMGRRARRRDALRSSQPQNQSLRRRSARTHDTATGNRSDRTALSQFIVEQKTGIGDTDRPFLARCAAHVGDDWTAGPQVMEGQAVTWCRTASCRPDIRPTPNHDFQRARDCEHPQGCPEASWATVAFRRSIAKLSGTELSARSLDPLPQVV
jgi:hypothetical protein